MSLVWTALIRHLLTPVGVYIASDDFKVQVTAAVVSVAAFGWSFLEKKVTNTEKPVSDKAAGK